MSFTTFDNKSIIVHKKRTTFVNVNFPYSVADRTIMSQIREKPKNDSPLIATWTVAKPNGGADGKVVLGLSQNLNITQSLGYMDIKVVTPGTIAVPAFDGYLLVRFIDHITDL